MRTAALRPEQQRRSDTVCSIIVLALLVLSLRWPCSVLDF
jgi:hypothetical protein